MDTKKCCNNLLCTSLHLSIYCKDLCRRCYDKERYHNNSLLREKIRTQQRKYYSKEKTKEKIRIRNKKWERNNPDKKKEFSRRYREKNRETLRQKGREYARSHREEQKRYTKYYKTLLIKEALKIYDLQCQNCDYTDISVLQWHHRFSQKRRETTLSVVLRINKINKKLEDVMLLCSNCHIKYDLIDNTSNRGSLMLQIAKELKE